MNLSRFARKTAHGEGLAHSISTEDPNLNVGRILVRMSRGGQAVPLGTIPEWLKDIFGRELLSESKHPEKSSRGR
jgi:hypothetical protein